ncbi:MAG: serine hydroxymethyltransferase [Cryobacterium sp.]|nr:serine hydroxymethyltransferase [Oligoflexia bacterium]
MSRPNGFDDRLAISDPEIFSTVEKEYERQQDGIELIASENYASRAVMETQGTILTNKYAEGYPGKRYYGGCEFVDVAEQLAIDRVCKLFGAEAANVQPHAGSQANMAVYMALLKPGDKVVGMSLAQGGHLTHGSPVNFSGKLYEAHPYGLNPKTETIDYDEVRDVVKKNKPKMLIAGASAYPRIIDFETMGAIARENNCDLVVDMAHIAGLIAAGLHPSPIPHATFTTSTTHKTLRGPRGGIILCKADRIKSVNSQIFPGIQGGPLMHVIAAKAVAFGEALKPEFKTYQEQVLTNAKTLAAELQAQGLRLVSGGTDNHLMLADLTKFDEGSISGKDAEAWLDLAHITVNKNSVPGDTRSPFVTSGIRIGTPAATTRGFGTSEMKQIATWIIQALRTKGNTEKLSGIGREVKALCGQFPVYR